MADVAHPEQTRGYIADRTEARRLIQALTEAADRDPRLVIDQLAAIRNCPHAIAAMGRALATASASTARPVRAQIGAGPRRARDGARGGGVHARPEERDDETGELHATHAMARWCLFGEVAK